MKFPISLLVSIFIMAVAAHTDTCMDSCNHLYQACVSYYASVYGKRSVNELYNDCLAIENSCLSKNCNSTDVLPAFSSSAPPFSDPIYFYFAATLGFLVFLF